MSHLKKEIVSKKINCKLLISKRVHTSCSSTRSCSDFKGNCSQCFSHAHHQPNQSLIWGCLCKKLLLQQTSVHNTSKTSTTFIYIYILLPINSLTKFIELLTRLSPISHLVTRVVDFFALETLSDDLGVTRRASPNNELGFRFCK